jgi:hypothetical protein
MQLLPAFATMGYQELAVSTHPKKTKKEHKIKHITWGVFLQSISYIFIEINSAW